MAHIDLPPEIARSQDGVDIAYYRLTLEFARRLQYCFKPLPQYRCELISSSAELGICSVYGYPASKAKTEGDNYSSETFSYRGLAAPETTYKELGLSQEENIIVRFNAKRSYTSEQPVHPPRRTGYVGIFVGGWELSRDSMCTPDFSEPVLTNAQQQKNVSNRILATNLLRCHVR